jgi:hypothetical protein
MTRWQGSPSSVAGGTVMAITLSPRSLLLLGMFATLNVGDLVSTWVDLHAGLREGNPFMNMLLAQHGFGALILYKILVVVVVSAITGALWAARPRLVGMTLLVCDLLVFAAVTANVLQFPPLAR